MSPIRPFERGDLPEVTKLYELVMRSGRPDPPPGLAPFFERMLFDHPWADEEIPSLVYLEDDGSIVAFQGSSVRRARFDGRPIRIGCAGQLVAHPNARQRAVGAILLHEYLAGAQDLTITDSASDEMREIWTRMGGDMITASCITWLKVLRPWGFADWLLSERRVRTRRGIQHELLSRLDKVTVKHVRAVAPPTEPSETAEPLTPAGLIEHLRLITDRVRLHLDYDEKYLTWLFNQLAAVRQLGSPVGQLVRAPDGRVAGWYIYCLLPGGASRVLHVAADHRDVGRVLDHLFHHAWSGGAVALLGRIEPRLLAPLADRRCVMRYAGTNALVHSRDADMLGAIALGNCLLTRLDGEWWMQDKLADLDMPDGDDQVFNGSDGDRPRVGLGALPL